MPEENATLRKDLFLAVNNVFWNVTPELRTSLQRDLTGLDQRAQAALADVRHLMGTDRALGTNVLSLNDAADKLASSVQTLTTSARFHTYALEISGA